MKEYRLGDLVLDYTIYPRKQIDSYHVHIIVDAIQNGAELPPIVIEKKTKRVVDGFHRHTAYKRVSGDNPECLVMCIEKNYKSEKDLFLDSMRFNASHGRTLSKYDRVHCLNVARELDIPDKDVAKILHIPPKDVQTLSVNRTAIRGNGKQRLEPIKGTIGHKAGQQLSDEQWQANTKLGGMKQSFYVNQLITLIENELIDTQDEKLMERLQRLGELLDGFLAAK